MGANTNSWNATSPRTRGSGRPPSTASASAPALGASGRPAGWLSGTSLRVRHDVLLLAPFITAAARALPAGGGRGNSGRRFGSWFASLQSCCDGGHSVSEKSKAKSFGDRHIDVAAFLVTARANAQDSSGDESHPTRERLRVEPTGRVDYSIGAVVGPGGGDVGLGMMGEHTQSSGSASRWDWTPWRGVSANGLRTVGSRDRLTNTFVSGAFAVRSSPDRSYGLSYSGRATPIGSCDAETSYSPNQNTRRVPTKPLLLASVGWQWTLRSHIQLGCAVAFYHAIGSMWFIGPTFSNRRWGRIRPDGKLTLRYLRVTPSSGSIGALIRAAWRKLRQVCRRQPRSWPNDSAALPVPPPVRTAPDARTRFVPA